MKSIKSLLRPKSVLIFVLFFSLTITACRKTSEEESTGNSSSTSTENTGQTVDGNPVSFNYALPSLIQQLSLTSETERFTPDQILRGSLYVINTDNSTNETYNWTVYSTRKNTLTSVIPRLYKLKKYSIL